MDGFMLVSLCLSVCLAFTCVCLCICVCCCCVCFLAGLLRDKSNLEAVKKEALDNQASTEERSRMLIEQQQQKIGELVQQKVRVQ